MQKKIPRIHSIMRPAMCTLMALVIGNGINASYYFECRAEVMITALQAEKVSFDVVSVRECGNHLQKGEKKATGYKSATAGKPVVGKIYRVIYHYMAPECMQKDGKPVDCHSELIEFVP